MFNHAILLSWIMDGQNVLGRYEKPGLWGCVDGLKTHGVFKKCQQDLAGHNSCDSAPGI